MDFFEVILSASLTKSIPPAYNLARQQCDANYYFHSSSLVSTAPYATILQTFNNYLSTSASITEAATIDRQFDALCRCASYNNDSPPLASALVVRLSTAVLLPPLSVIEELRLFLDQAPHYPSTWLHQSLPYMNKSSWVKRHVVYTQARNRKTPRSALPSRKQSTSALNTDAIKKVTFSA